MTGVPIILLDIATILLSVAVLLILSWARLFRPPSENWWVEPRKPEPMEDKLSL